ncbi:hypothetical protein [Sediminibacterium sp. C3]|uniref:hypothetical protein n=1 Tax=Sediminibacterium sp. C3 TaxID=1267211 RepID=UPI00040C5ACC|nr:hypothetical protein [Sediminibacterium sp. C3]
MRGLMLFLFITQYSLVSGQYYYTDLIGLQQTQKNYEIIRKNRIKLISGTGIDAEGNVTILSRTEIPTDGKKITRTLSENNSIKELVYQFYELGRLKKTTIKKPGTETIIEYQYNPNGLLTTLISITKDSASGSSISELHQWEYSSGGTPKKMIKKTSGMDSVTIEFQTDSAGLVLEETWIKKDKKIETYYFYYNSENRISDIVRYNTTAQKLLPDFVFEYNENGQLIKMIQIGLNGRNITHWNYSYYPNGLREKEIAKDRNKSLIISTQYQFEKH